MGVIAIDESVAAVTTTVVVPEVVLNAARMAEVPATIALTSPVELTVATVVSAEDQVTRDVMSADVPSE